MKSQLIKRIKRMMPVRLRLSLNQMQRLLVEAEVEARMSAGVAEDAREVRSVVVETKRWFGKPDLALARAKKRNRHQKLSNQLLRNLNLLKKTQRQSLTLLLPQSMSRKILKMSQLLKKLRLSQELQSKWKSQQLKRRKLKHLHNRT